jgi:hypothetical protein
MSLSTNGVAPAKGAGPQRPVHDPNDAHDAHLAARALRGEERSVISIDGQSLAWSDPIGYLGDTIPNRRDDACRTWCEAHGSDPRVEGMTMHRAVGAAQDTPVDGPPDDGFYAFLASIQVSCGLVSEPVDRPGSPDSSTEPAGGLCHSDGLLDDDQADQQASEGVEGHGDDGRVPVPQ